MMTKKRSMLCAVVFCVALGGCAGTSGTGWVAAPPLSGVFEEGHDSKLSALPPALSQPFTDFWAAVRAKDWKAAHKFEAPDFQAHFNHAFYSGYHEKAHDITRIAVLNSQIEPARALIQIRVNYRNPENKRETAYTFWDQWVLGEEGWYHILNDTLLRQHAQGVIDHAKTQAKTE
jgi:hypothetical protein